MTAPPAPPTAGSSDYWDVPVLKAKGGPEVLEEMVKVSKGRVK